MRIHLGCLDGHTYISDHVSELDMQADIDKQNADPNTSMFPITTVDDLMNEFVKTVMNEGGRGIKVSITMNGRDRYFRPDSIVWVEVVR